MDGEWRVLKRTGAATDRYGGNATDDAHILITRRSAESGARRAASHIASRGPRKQKGPRGPLLYRNGGADQRLATRSTPAWVLRPSMSSMKSRAWPNLAVASAPVATSM